MASIYCPSRLCEQENSLYKVNAVTWLLWPAVCVRMMKVIHIWNDWLSFFHSSPVEQTPSIIPFDVLLCVSNSHSVGRYMCHTVCLVSILEKDSEHSKQVMQPRPFSLCLIVIHVHPLQTHVCATVLQLKWLFRKLPADLYWNWIGKIKVRNKRRSEYVYEMDSDLS